MHISQQNGLPCKQNTTNWRCFQYDRWWWLKTKWQQNQIDNGTFKLETHWKLQQIGLKPKNQNHRTWKNENLRYRMALWSFKKCMLQLSWHLIHATEWMADLSSTFDRTWLNQVFHYIMGPYDCVMSFFWPKMFSTKGLLTCPEIYAR